MATVQLPRNHSADSGDQELRGALDRVDRKLRWMIVALFAIALALTLQIAALFGYIVEFHAGEGLLVGSASASGVALGFVFGWICHATVRRVA
jgi:hypothetical protein